MHPPTGYHELTVPERLHSNRPTPKMVRARELPSATAAAAAAVRNAGGVGPQPTAAATVATTALLARWKGIGFQMQHT